MRNKLFYHIPRLKELQKNFIVGQSLKIDNKTLNQSILDILNFSLMLDIGTGKGSQGLINVLFHDKEDLSEKLPDWTELMLDVLLKTTRRYTEIVFESVRFSDYPKLPSRHNCIFLSEQENVKDWYPAISPDKQAPIFEVKVKESYHLADQRFVQDNDVLPHENFVRNAHKYWKSEKYTQNEQTVWEVLYTGELDVIRKFDNMEDFNSSMF